jgi:hypothetical protein
MPTALFLIVCAALDLTSTIDHATHRQHSLLTHGGIVVIAAANVVLSPIVIADQQLHSKWSVFVLS